MRKSVVYSQNFLTNKQVVTQLVKESAISKEDTVYEIGVGKGIITNELIKASKKVVAFELDDNLYRRLTQRFEDNKFLKLLNIDFLDYPLPRKSYKVFSNIPFNITSAIIRKLTQPRNSPSISYLIVQKEAAQKFAGKPYSRKNSQMAILIKPWFDLQIVHRFKRLDFSPKPKVDTVLLKIERRDKSHIELVNRNNYQDFVVYTFNQFKPNIAKGLTPIFGNKKIVNLNIPANTKPSELDYKNWLILFKEFRKLPYDKKSKVERSYEKLQVQQNKLEKIHRTRKDKAWRVAKKFPK